MICSKCLEETSSKKFSFNGIEYGNVCPACRVGIRQRKLKLKKLQYVKSSEVDEINEMEKFFKTEARLDFLRKRKY